MKPTTISQRGEDYRRLESTTDDHTKKNDNCIKPRKKMLSVNIDYIYPYVSCCFSFLIWSYCSWQLE